MHPFEFRHMGNGSRISKLMELRGQEPVLEGYTLDDGFDWCIESIENVYRKRKARGASCPGKSMGTYDHSKVA